MMWALAIGLGIFMISATLGGVLVLAAGRLIGLGMLLGALALSVPMGFVCCDLDPGCACVGTVLR